MDEQELTKEIINLMQGLNPAQHGICAGYLHDDPDAPSCPYDLRTKERRQWHEGRLLGKRLRQRHDDAFETLLDNHKD